MNQSSLNSEYADIVDQSNDLSMERRKQVLTTRFLVLGMIGILLISVLMSLGGYFRLQINETRALAERTHAQLVATARAISTGDELGSDSAYDAMGRMGLSRVSQVLAIKIFDADHRLVWQGAKHNELPDSSANISLSVNDPYHVLTPVRFDNASFLKIFTGDYQPVQLASLLPLQGKRAFVLLMLDNSAEFNRQRNVAMRLMLFLLLSTFLLFGLLYVTFLRGIRTIDEQEQKLNQQIASLSNLLTINKSMQRSIRTASARAVELNEQFLRRVGADLHDGPAQMIGFSIMRLNQALEKDESGLIGPEFHAIKQALEESLEEIRGISSGLVLPELETMTLEQCMRKVVLLHTSVHPTEVGEFYQEIEESIPLPIKICAYRFVQEGLNNAHRHGQAEKCKLSVSLKDHVLQISLKDNGIGFRKSQLTNNGKHLGLIGLKDRIESLGGRLMINSELGVGTSLKLSMSLVDEG